MQFLEKRRKESPLFAMYGLAMLFKPQEADNAISSLLYVVSIVYLQKPCFF